MEQQGSRTTIAPIAKIRQKQEHTQIVLGLGSDEALLPRLQAAGGQVPGSLTRESYAIRLTRQQDLVTVWAIGADATGAMYAGLALAETIAQDGLEAVEGEGPG